ncbi:DUF3616 domain-containing protein [Pseudomonas sp. NPDC089569]|uniref:DUF3616 domain-containing protein n=1 Tax=Pseudomonas sp. NPDC089569 TaxID=3390722 RepID=UPI003CFFD950
MNRAAKVLLKFDSQYDLDEKKKLRDGLSAVVQIGQTLWLANDETLSLECFDCQDQAAVQKVYDNHRQFALGDLLQLPAPAISGQKFEEADIEGLAFDQAQQYLWLIGSHSLKRKQPDARKDEGENIERLSKVSSDGNRYLLARIPVVNEDGILKLVRTTSDSQRTAAQLAGQQSWSALTRALGQDEHLRGFFAIPGKDNGFDIEGLAIAGKRLFIGLRGPVLRGWAIIIEIEPEQDRGDPHTLKLARIDEEGALYRKHFIQLDGLGIRDLCVDGNDMLILAGPTMDLDGPVTVSRWINGVNTTGNTVVFREKLARVLDVPFGYRGDHAEGMTLFSTADSPGRQLLLVYDTPLGRGDNSSVEADIFEL